MAGLVYICYATWRSIAQSLADRARRQFASSARRRSPVECAATTSRALPASSAGPRATCKQHTASTLAGRRPRDL